MLRGINRIIEENLLEPLLYVEAPITCYLVKYEASGVMFNTKTAEKLVKPIEQRTQQLT